MLIRRFDRRSPSLQRELHDFSAEVFALEQAVAPAAVTVQTEVQGEVLEVRILREPVCRVPQMKSTG
jgi:hypothetical protein